MKDKALQADPNFVRSMTAHNGIAKAPAAHPKVPDKGRKASAVQTTLGKFF